MSRSTRNQPGAVTGSMVKRDAQHAVHARNDMDFVRHRNASHEAPPSQKQAGLTARVAIKWNTYENRIDHME